MHTRKALPHHMPPIHQAVVVTHWVTLLIRLCGICYVCDCRGSMSKQVVMVRVGVAGRQLERFPLLTLL